MDVTGPLVQFQSTLDNEDDTRKLVHSINSCGEKLFLEGERLDKVFDMYWPTLKAKLDAIEVTDDVPTATRDTENGMSSAILEEMLEILRAQQRTINTPELLLPREYLVSIDTDSRIHPKALRDLGDMRDWIAHQPTAPSQLVDDAGHLVDYLERFLDRGHRRPARRTPRPASQPELQDTDSNSDTPEVEA